MTEYIPTTDEVQGRYISSRIYLVDFPEKKARKEFDRWLAQVEAAAKVAAPQAESAPKSSYISPSLPAQIRGLYRADLRERSIQTMLDLAGDLIQELIDLKAAQVLPSSGIDEDKLAEVLRSYLPMGEDPALDATAKAQARAVAEWLKGQEQ